MLVLLPCGCGRAVRKGILAVAASHNEDPKVVSVEALVLVGDADLVSDSEPPGVAVLFARNICIETAQKLATGDGGSKGLVGAVGIRITHKSSVSPSSVG
jgi:hypothetical protein